MVNLAYHAEVLKLLAEVEAIAADLTPGLFNAPDLE